MWVKLLFLSHPKQKQLESRESVQCWTYRAANVDCRLTLTVNEAPSPYLSHWTDQNPLWHLTAKRYIRRPLLYMLRPKTQRTGIQRESLEDTQIVLPSIVSHMIQRHVWCNTAELTPPASGQPPLTTNVERENKNPALPRNAREKRLSQSVKGADFKGYSNLGAARLALGGGCSQWGIPMTDPGAASQNVLQT